MECGERQRSLCRIGGHAVGDKRETSGGHKKATGLVVNIFIDIFHLDKRVYRECTGKYARVRE